MLLGNMPDIENCAEPEILSNENGKVTFRAILSTNYSKGVHYFFTCFMLVLAAALFLF